MTSTDSNQAAARAAKAIAKHRPEREVGGDEHADAGPVGQVVAHARLRRVVPPGRADHDVHAGVDQRVHVATPSPPGTVKSIATSRAGRRRQVVARVEGGDELEVVGSLHGSDDGGSHAARRPEDGHLDALAHGGRP